MQAFTLARPTALDAAISGAGGNGAKYIAGGTDLMQLMKDNVEAPTHLIDLEPLPLTGIRADGAELRLGAMARMSDVAAHPAVRDGWPVISQALEASASPQVRISVPWAATCCSASAAATSATRVSPATSACPVPAVRRLPGKTGCWPSWAAAIIALPRTLPTLPWRWWR